MRDIFKNPPTPLPCLRGRRKGRAKHCPWQHRSCGQPMHVFVHPRHTFDPRIHTSHATFHVFCPPTGAQGSVFGLPALGFRWSLGFSHSAALSAASGRLANASSVLGSDLGGVWLFRIHCWRASFLFLFRLRFLSTHCGHLLLLRGFFKGALSAACGRVANAPFLACLSSDLGGVWLFRIRCWRASFLPLSRLGCVTVFAHLLRPFTSP